MLSRCKFNLNQLKNIQYIFKKTSILSQNNFNYRNLVNKPEYEVQITIGDVTKLIKSPDNPELVPQKYIEKDKNGNLILNQTVLNHLRWMIQKDNLKQDMFLIGYPGSMRRTLAMQYLELTKRELEYIALSRDTTESDLKQRREIQDKQAIYYDQCAVRAAINGRILILDGVEHTERNVLPILNNLLENREMHLENGKFLMSPERYDELLKTNSKETLDKWGLIRVSDDFRVIALGLPTQKYKGTPLDPPFRSRFQSRNITHYSFEEILSDLKKLTTNVSDADLEKLLSFAMATHSSEPSTNLPDFPIDNLKLAIKLMNSNHSISVHDAIVYLYPYETAFTNDKIERVKSLLNSFHIKPSDQNQTNNIEVEKMNGKKNTKFIIDKNQFLVNGGPNKYEKNLNDNNFVDLNHQKNILSLMIQMYSIGDICLIGKKGVGKTMLTNELIKLLGQSIEPIVLYEDMTARDFIQQRITTLEGDTVWRDSPLIRAAKTGTVAILDGINRLHKSTITVLQRLIHDREIQLCDGTTLVRPDRYESLRNSGLSEYELTRKGFSKIHDSFRIIAIAELTNSTSPNALNWLTPELLSLFMFVEVRPLLQNEEYKIIQHLYGEIDPSLKKIITLSHNLRESKDPVFDNLSETLSTRQILKIAKRMATYPSKFDTNLHNSTYDIIQNTFLAKFMPALPRHALENAMKKSKIYAIKNNGIKEISTIDVKRNKLRIGNTEMDLHKTTTETKVPSTLFYDVPQHIELLEKLLQDFLIGDHILLVGNQGVGKNKLIDKLLQLMLKPREYLQLHRDTTVHSLTVQSTLRDGQVVYEDSPLVKAVKKGHVLVIDEADKAPVNVTCILRTLVENGEMTLSDGRKIVPSNRLTENHKDIIKTHSNFRIIVLANRPGFPFLGNDFYASLGDVFTCHAVDNPSPDSETFLLQQYGPSVPNKILKMLVNAFGELRTMADEGLLNYPYSTREVVNIVKHLQKYPKESMSELIGNVLDFDKYSPETLDQVTEVLQKHGLQIEHYANNELFALRRQKTLQMTVESVSGKNVSEPKHGKVDPKNEPHVGGNTWAGGTGGRDTAGLGGKGGPYRLDAGHKVHQLSDQEKDSIPEHVKLAAREMNRKAFADKLKEIKMTPYDYKIYAQFSEPNRKQVQQLKSILSALQTKSNERQWQKYQTSGELDDTRLIEGITGEKNIYRQRTEVNPFAEQVQEKPNRLQLVVDVSGSMYRFNNYDGRLDRQLEAVVMVMEAFEGYENKILYDIVGHSGECCDIPFINKGKPPINDQERLGIVRMMHAHSQFCWAGDNTLEATRKSINSLSEETDNDNSIVIVLSDANLSRYKISEKDLSEALMKGEPKVHGHVIFIGSLAEEAYYLNKRMPPGHSNICMDVALLPQILKQIFTSSIL